jgi:HSF-type DNA-binding
MDTSLPSKIKIASSEIHCPTTISQNQLAMDASIQDVAAGDSFPLKLWKLLSFAEQTGKTDVISWLEDGTKFKVHDKNRFASEIMPHYFASSTYKSFQRSKNLWGFQTVSKGVHKGECSHPLFRRGDINLCRKMVRRAKSDEGADMEASEQTSTGATNNATSNVGSAPASNLGQQPGGNVMHQSLLDNFSGLNPSLFLAQQQQMQQQQQLSSLNPFLGAAGLGGQTSNMMPNPTNPLLSVLASLGNNNGNANILSALQQKMQAPTPAPVHSMSALQQLLQLNPQPPPQQTPASSLNQQIMALLALQQKQQQPTGSGVPDIAILSAAASVAAKGPPVASVAAPGPSATPPVSAIDTSAKKTKGRRKGKESASKAADSGGNFKEKNGDLTSKTNSLREAALARGSKVVACRARGMAMEHNMHVSCFCAAVLYIFV